MQSRILNFGLSTLLFASACANASDPSDSGALDMAFGSAGKVTIAAATEAHAMSSITAADVAAQADGKIVIVGNDDNGSVFAVRLNSDGSIDTGFGGTQGFPPGFVGYCCGVADGIAVRPDGRIVFAYHNAVGSAIFIAQFLANGTADAAFGIGNGYTYAQPASGDALYGGRMLIDADGTIDVVGTYHQQNTDNNEFFFDRFAADGKSDQPFQYEFGSGSNQDDHAFGVAVDNQGRYLVSGYHRGAAGNYDCAVIRIDRDLFDVDRTFGFRSVDDYGSVTIAFDYGGDNFDTCNAVANQDGYVVLAGDSTHPTGGGTYQAATLALLDSTGAIVIADPVGDPVAAKFAFAFAQSNSGAINTVGKIIIDPYNTKYSNVYAIGTGRAGTSPHGPVFGIARLLFPINTNFTLDPDFNGGSPIDPYFVTRPDGLGLQSTDNNAASGTFSNGRLVVVGTTNVDGSSQIAVARLAPFDGISRNGFDVPYY